LPACTSHLVFGVFSQRWLEQEMKDKSGQ